MFDMMPFGWNNNSSNNLMKTFGDFERSLFQEMDWPNMGFRTDIEDKGDRYELTAELPGFKKEDIKIGVQNNMLTIKAQHEENNSETDKNKNYVRRERHYGMYERSFSTDGINSEQISASYDNGILRVDLPKSQVVESPSQQIEIK